MSLLERFSPAGCFSILLLRSHLVGLESFGLDFDVEASLVSLELAREEFTYSFSELLVINRRVEFPAVLGGSEPAGKGCVKVLALCGK